MDALPDLPSALAIFGSGLSQHARLLTLTSAQQSDLPESLMAERFSGREAVNELFRFDVDALSVSTDLELDQFIGEELTVRLLQPDGSRRAWHGICTEASWLGADGGAARYRLRLEPALALLGLRRDNFIFQDKTVRDIAAELAADYPQLRLEFDVSQELAPRAICTQYRESDLEFLVRILASEGLNWRFEHDQDGEEDHQDSGVQQAKHRLVIFDSRAAAPPVNGGDQLRFHGMRATDSDDAIDHYAARRQVRANAVAISSWDPLQVLAPAAEQSTSLEGGELPTLAVYDGSGERSYTASGAADPHSRLMLQALEMENKLFEGAGAVRRLAAGHAFNLTQHERYEGDDSRFTALWVEHEARNNFTPALKNALPGIAPGTYRNRFGCVRATVAIVPRATAERNARTASGPQTALVVGLPDAVSTTVRDHQVRVQFAWQRGSAANAGGMAHNHDTAGNAPGNDSSGAWVRVAEALAGPNWGSQFTPRIGTEVLIDFIEGDIDRPVVVAQLYTGSDTPPYAAGVDSGVNHAGAIAGIHSNSFDGGGYNQWVMDDTPGQLRTRLATSSAATQLNLGYLIQQAPGSAQRGAYRGSGFELRTDAWSVLRSGEGLLLTTSARKAQGAGVSSTQLDAAEAVGRLQAAKELSKVLGNAARQQSALASKDAGEAQRKLIEQIDPQQKGKHEGSVNGQSALQAQAGSRDVDADRPVEKFDGAVTVMDSAAAINWASPASTVLFAGRQLHWATQSDVQMTAQHTLSSVAANAVNYFTHGGGIKAIAANGPVSLHAHTGQLDIVADKEVVVISVNDAIEIKASQKVTLQAGQSSIVLEGGNITFTCPGNFTVKGGQHVFDGGASKAGQFEVLPDAASKLDNFIALNYRDPDGEPMAGVGYKILFAGGAIIKGKLDKDGYARHENVPEKPISAEYEAREPSQEKPWNPLAEMVAKAREKFGQ